MEVKKDVRKIDANNLIEEISSLRITMAGKELFTDIAKDVVLRIIDEQMTIPGSAFAPLTKTHTSWMISSDGHTYCSACKHESENGKMTNYCPHCGVRMGGNKNNESMVDQSNGQF